MTTPSPIDLKQALLDPAEAFGEPEKVLEHPTLSRDQKIEILRRWQYDANELEVASEEGMSGGEPSLVRRVAKALTQLDGHAERAGGPTKHGSS